ncbi:MAG: hypothetical protein ACO1SX_11155 [Actinomycetota bacterium]
MAATQVAAAPPEEREQVQEREVEALLAEMERDRARPFGKPEDLYYGRKRLRRW